MEKNKPNKNQDKCLKISRLNDKLCIIKKELINIIKTKGLSLYIKKVI